MALFCCAVPIDDLAVDVGGDNGLPDRVEQACLETNPLLSLDALGNVPGADHEPPDIRIVEEVVPDGLHVAPRAVGGPDPEAHGRRNPGRLAGLGEGSSHRLQVVGVGELGWYRTD